MAINFSIDGGSPFRIKRPGITSSGFVSDVDPRTKAELDELNTLLGKRIFGTRAEGDGNKTVQELIPLPLTPKQVSEGRHHRDHWQVESLLDRVSKADEEADLLTLADYIDLVPSLSELKYTYENSLSSNFSLFDYNTRTVLNE